MVRDLRLDRDSIYGNSLDSSDKIIRKILEIEDETKSSAIYQSKNDITATALIYEESLSEYDKTANVVDTVLADVEGFRSLSRMIKKTRYNAGAPAQKHSLRKFTADLNRSGDYERVIFAMNVYTDSLQEDETATVEFTVQAGEGDSVLTSNSFSKSLVLDLENNKPMTIYWEVPASAYKAFKNGLFGITVKDQKHPVEVYTSFAYAGYNSNIAQVAVNPFAYGDYALLFQRATAITVIDGGTF